MKVTVLGKYGPYPAAGGGTSSYLVEGENTSVVLDFGSGALGRLFEFTEPTKLSAIVLSHLHYDHICDLLPLSYYLKAKNATLPLIFPDTDCFQRKILDDLEGFELVPLQAQTEVGEFTLKFEKMQHPLESYAVKVSDGNRTLTYSGDTSFCVQLSKFATGSNLLILDCGKERSSSAPHLSLSDAAYIGKSLNARIIASHLNPDIEYTSPSEQILIAEELKSYEV